MTFCKEMSSRVEELFCENRIYAFLGIYTHYCSDLCMFLIRLKHLIAVLAIFETTALTQQNVKHPFMAASWGYKHLVIL